MDSLSKPMFDPKGEECFYMLTLMHIYFLIFEVCMNHGQI